MNSTNSPRMVLETTLEISNDLSDYTNDVELRLELSTRGDILHADVLEPVRDGSGKIAGKSSQGITVWMAWKLLGGRSEKLQRALLEAYHAQEEKP